jgi:hypothetical protein
METQPVSNRMFALVVLYDMQTPFFHSALEGISDEDANNRLSTKANHIAWLAGSLVQQRYELANLLGIDKKQGADELFNQNKGIQDGVVYPGLASFRKDWDSITPGLREAFLKVTEEQLNKVLEFPGMSFPLYDMITFSTYREANCIGQIALWRRLLNYDAMKYM